MKLHTTSLPPGHLEKLHKKFQEDALINFAFKELAKIHDFAIPSVLLPIPSGEAIIKVHLTPARKQLAAHLYQMIQERIDKHYAPLKPFLTND